MLTRKIIFLISRHQASGHLTSSFNHVAFSRTRSSAHYWRRLYSQGRNTAQEKNRQEQLRMLSKLEEQPKRHRSLSIKILIALFAVPLSVVGADYYRSYSERYQLNKEAFSTHRRLLPTDLSPDLRLLCIERRAGSTSVWQVPPNSFYSLEVKNPDLQIARSYTPLPLPPGRYDVPDMKPPSTLEKLGLIHYPSERERLIRLLVRKRPGGEVSGYLHGLHRTGDIELRGFSDEFIPNETEGESDRDYDNILILAGGTGVATALQGLDLFLRKRSKQWGSGRGDNRDGSSSILTRPNVNILWAVRSSSDWTNRIDGLQQQRQASGWSDRFREEKPKFLSPVFSAIASVSKSSPGQELQAWRDAFPKQVDVKYFSDQENIFITPELVDSIIDKADRPSPPLKEGEDVFKERKSRNLVIVSGPEGFVDAFAGPRYWSEGKLKQGPVAGILGEIKIMERGWDVWKA